MPALSKAAQNEIKGAGLLREKIKTMCLFKKLFCRTCKSDEVRRDDLLLEVEDAAFREEADAAFKEFRLRDAEKIYAADKERLGEWERRYLQIEGDHRAETREERKDLADKIKRRIKALEVENNNITAAKQGIQQLRQNAQARRVYAQFLKTYIK